jgi:Aspartyl/Asparaginyl beta-hydroxylase
MRHFQLLGTADMGPLRLALQTRPNLWNRHPYRTSFEGTPFGGMDDILLRYSRPEMHEGQSDPLAVVNDTFLVQYDAWGALSEAHEVIFNLMRRFRGIALGRVIIARLPMGGMIKPHADDYGTYAARDDGLRFHVCVQGLPGCLFHCGDETVQMQTGEVWWFNHRAMHSAENNSADERIHLLVDIQTG